MRRGDGSASPPARRGLVPRRTIRAVLFTGEEYLVAGAKAYRERHGHEHHVAAFETDYGMAAPDAIGVGNEETARALAPLLPVFERFGIRRFRPHAFGADVQPIVETGVPAFDLEPDGHHYFDIHHTAADTLEQDPTRGSPPERRRDRAARVSARRAVTAPSKRSEEPRFAVHVLRNPVPLLARSGE